MIVSVFPDLLGDLDRDFSDICQGRVDSTFIQMFLRDQASTSLAKKGVTTKNNNNIEQ